MENLQLNKEMELLAGIGRAIIKYFDYIALFFALPLIFDVPFFDITSFLAIAAIIAVKAISPIISYAFITKEPEHKEVINEKKEASLSIPALSVPETPQPERKEDIIFHSLITDEKKDTIKTNGPKPITVKNTEGDAVITLDGFRTLRVKKDEIRNLYTALMQAEFTFFSLGKWDLQIKAKKQT